MREEIAMPPSPAVPRRLVAALGIALILSLAPGAARPAAGQEAATVAEATRYRVNYRPAAADPWQLYAESRTQDKADAIADEIRQAGYQAEVVDNSTPTPQPMPDYADTSASGYYPASNW